MFCVRYALSLSLSLSLFTHGNFLSLLFHPLLCGTQLFYLRAPLAAYLPILPPHSRARPPRRQLSSGTRVHSYPSSNSVLNLPLSQLCAHSFLLDTSALDGRSAALSRPDRRLLPFLPPPPPPQQPLFCPSKRFNSDQKSGRPPSVGFGAFVTSAVGKYPAAAAARSAFEATERKEGRKEGRWRRRSTIRRARNARTRTRRTAAWPLISPPSLVPSRTRCPGSASRTSSSLLPFAIPVSDQICHRR